jgi:4-hydroxybenzoyl-CoA reductase subunit beta
VGPAGSRRLPAGAFYTADGLANTVLAEGELVVACELPLAPARTSAYEKLRLRGAIDFPLLSVAARLDAPGGLVDELSLVVSALAAKPRSVQGARAASGLARAELPVQAIAAAARRECVPLDNVDGDAAWRRDMVPVLVGRALARL